MALVCQMAVSQLRKFSQKEERGYEIISQRGAIFAADAWELRNYFATRAIFAGALFRLRNFADHAFSLLLSSS